LCIGRRRVAGGREHEECSAKHGREYFHFGLQNS
jgi:hypothetical protein